MAISSIVAKPTVTEDSPIRNNSITFIPYSGVMSLDCQFSGKPTPSVFYAKIDETSNSWNRLDSHVSYIVCIREEHLYMCMLRNDIISGDLSTESKIPGIIHDEYCITPQRPTIMALHQLL